jgi:hypothetical protein
MLDLEGHDKRVVTARGHIEGKGTLRYRFAQEFRLRDLAFRGSVPDLLIDNITIRGQSIRRRWPIPADHFGRSCTAPQVLLDMSIVSANGPIMPGDEMVVYGSSNEGGDVCVTMTGWTPAEKTDA